QWAQSGMTGAGPKAVWLLSGEGCGRADLAVWAGPDPWAFSRSGCRRADATQTADTGRKRSGRFGVKNRKKQTFVDRHGAAACTFTAAPCWTAAAPGPTPS